MLICLFLSPRFIRMLRRREFGQQIREEGPSEHQTKAGTPTMGGLIIFIAVAIPFLILNEGGRDGTAALTVFGIALGCAALGFADDYIKIVKQRSLGLPARYKLLGQVLLALILWWVARHELGLEPELFLRIGGDASIYIGPVLYFLLVFLVIAGATNGVNLTDGLDGLAIGPVIVAALTFGALCYLSGASFGVFVGSPAGISVCTHSRSIASSSAVGGPEPSSSKSLSAWAGGIRRASISSIASSIQSTASS